MLWLQHMFFNNWLSRKALQAGAFSINPVSLGIISIRFPTLQIGLSIFRDF